MTIIGISGFARAGKDSFGDALVKHYEFEKVSFATPMKRMAEAIDPILGTRTSWGCEVTYRLSDLLQEGGWEQAKADPEVREFLQRLGTEAGREIFGEDFWVDHALRAYDESRGLTRVVVCDVRFRNEVDAIRQRGGEVLRIRRPGFDAPNGHRSEQELADFRHDLYINNDGTLADLEEKAHEYFSLLLLARNLV